MFCFCIVVNVKWNFKAVVLAGDCVYADISCGH
nr:MAG TPA: hypothetical protein [Caudoviricetes sp.]DAV58482.1 MAG TPA: hypothetical protein [Caudoviricetes sp.]DAY58645.1 MAG TPA: hypothetical protein [Caudoviricetes sp.]